MFSAVYFNVLDCLCVKKNFESFFSLNFDDLLIETHNIG